MSRDKPKKYGEEFSVSPIPERKGVYYYNPKIVGVNFKSNLNPSLSRRSVISTFLELKEKQIELLSDNETKIRITGLVRQGKIGQLRDSVQDHIKLIQEPKNKYDPNAIAVFVSIGPDPGYLDVGYIPKDHAKIIKENYPESYLIGAHGEGVGLRLDIILYKRGVMDKFAEPFAQVVEPEKVPPAFLSLKKMRRSLEM